MSIGNTDRHPHWGKTSPVGTDDNSPTIHRWVSRASPKSPRAPQGRKNASCDPRTLCRPGWDWFLLDLGVHRVGDKWEASVGHRGRGHYVGRFDDEEEAAKARDREKLELAGEFAALNFPEEAAQ